MNETKKGCCGGKNSVAGPVGYGFVVIGGIVAGVILSPVLKSIYDLVKEFVN